MAWKDWAKTTSRRDENHLSFGIWCAYIRDFMYTVCSPPETPLFWSRTILSFVPHSVDWILTHCYTTTLAHCNLKMFPITRMGDIWVPSANGLRGLDAVLPSLLFTTPYIFIGYFVALIYCACLIHLTMIWVLNHFIRHYGTVNFEWGITIRFVYKPLQKSLASR